MFNDNWFLFLLVIMLIFFADGNVSPRESAVLLGIVFALAMTNDTPTQRGGEGDVCHST